MDLFYKPRQTVVDGTGTPLAGAKLYFYRAGTATPTDTYTDQALTTPSANPVVADSEGEFAAIWMGTAYDYKVVLKTSADATLWTEDDVQNSAIAAANLATDSVTTIKIADNAVTLAKQAHGTQGGIQYYGTSGAPAELAASTAEFVLTTKSTSNDPVWQASPLPTGFSSGLVLSQNATDADHDVDITAGVIRDSSDTVNITCAAMTKQADTAWSAGTANGGLSTGTLTLDTNYYLFAISKADGTQDYMFDVSADPTANLPTDYLYYAALNGGVALITDASANVVNSYHGVFRSELFWTAAAGQSTDYAHGFADDPTSIQLVGVRKTAAEGWSIGERHILGNSAFSTVNYGYSFVIKDGTVGVQTGDAGTLAVTVGSGSFSVMTTAEWDYQIVARA